MNCKWRTQEMGKCKYCTYTIDPECNNYFICKKLKRGKIKHSARIAKFVTRIIRK